MKTLVTKIASILVFNVFGEGLDGMKWFRMRNWRGIQVLIAGLLLCGTPPSLAQVADGQSDRSGFRSPIDTPAIETKFPASAPMLAVTRAGKRFVAVGLRGQIIFSDDQGSTWTQADVPVDADLVAVNFPSPDHGWAVGHLGVVLETTDGGTSWHRKFVGQDLNKLVRRYYEALPPPLSEGAQRATEVAASLIEGEVPTSLLNVWFWTPSSGIIVGEFNTIFRTEDGGKTWAPMMDRTENPGELHFYGAHGGEDGLFIAGEDGQVWRLDKDSDRWVSVATGYGGTLFGLVASGQKVVAFGMRGTVYYSESAGNEWHPVATPHQAGIVDGFKLNGGGVVLADQAGRYIFSEDGGSEYTEVLTSGSPAVFSIAHLNDSSLIWAGASGIGDISFK